MTKTKTKSKSRREGNLANIYSIPNGYYLNWQCDGHVYRRAFKASNPKHPSMAKALKAAVVERDWLEAHREEIRAEIKRIVAAENPMPAKTKRRVRELSQEARALDQHQDHPRAIKASSTFGRVFNE